MNDTQIALLAARTLIADPECWTQGAWARDKDGKALFLAISQGCCWCARGAIEFVADDEPGHLRTQADFALKMIVGGVACWNDHPRRTHAEILAGFDRAIELAA